MRSRKAGSSPAAGRRGMVMVFVALLMPVIVGAMAMAVDAGVLYLQRRQAQSAADAAALAGAYSLYNGSNFSVAQGAAASVASRNGFTLSGTNVTQPGATQVAVTVASNPPRFFSSLWGRGSQSIAASATAQANSGSSATTPYSSSAVVLLNPSAPGSLSLAGSAQIKADDGIQVNSRCTTAVDANNAGCSSSPIHMCGGYTTSSGGCLDGRLTTGVPSVGDPLASIPTPTDPGSGSNQDGCLKSYPGYGPCTLNPGQYTQSVSLGNGGTFTMNPGLYYFKGGAGLTVANGATLTGNGVTIYMENGGTLSLQGGTTTTLTAPTSSSNGAVQGLVYMQDRSCTAAPNIANGTNVSLTGTFYTAGAPLNFAGGNISNFASQVVADSMNLSNNAQVSVNYSASKVAGTPGAYNYPVALVQ